MSIPTSRASGTAEIVIDFERCTSCGICVEVCKGGPLYLEEDRLRVDQARGFGCIACGACVAACPSGAILISGRDLFPEDVLPLPEVAERAGYESLRALLVARRSTRNFRSQQVAPGLVDQILESAATAPMGLPPSDVGVLVFRTPGAVAELCDDLLEAATPWKRLFSPTLLTLLRPFIGKVNADMFAKFVGPALNMFIEKKQQGIDWLFYGAPLVMYFYGTEYCDPADPIVAASLAMVAGESLGLGTCLLGFPGYIFQYSKTVRRKYHLPEKIQPGLAVIFGVTKYPPRHALKRRFRDVRVYS